MKLYSLIWLEPLIIYYLQSFSRLYNLEFIYNLEFVEINQRSLSKSEVFFLMLIFKSLKIISYLKCDFLMTPHVRLLVVRSNG